MSNEKVIQVTSETFAAEVDGAPGLVLADFWAPWCGPCRAVAPILDDIAEAYDGRVKVVKINTDDERDLARRHGVMSIPTLMFFRAGQLLERTVGVRSQADLSAMLDGFLHPQETQQTETEPEGQEEN